MTMLSSLWHYGYLSRVLDFELSEVLVGDLRQQYFVNYMTRTKQGICHPVFGIQNL